MPPTEQIIPRGCEVVNAHVVFLCYAFSENTAKLPLPPIGKLDFRALEKLGQSMVSRKETTTVK